MTPTAVTDLFLLGVILVLLVWEGYTLLNKAPGDHITARVRHWSKRPMIPFCIGVLIGHFLWY